MVLPRLERTQQWRRPTQRSPWKTVVLGLEYPGRIIGAPGAGTAIVWGDFLAASDLRRSGTRPMQGARTLLAADATCARPPYPVVPPRQCAARSAWHPTRDTWGRPGSNHTEDSVVRWGSSDRARHAWNRASARYPRDRASRRRPPPICWVGRSRPA